MTLEDRIKMAIGDAVMQACAQATEAETLRAQVAELTKKTAPAPNSTANEPKA